MRRVLGGEKKRGMERGVCEYRNRIKIVDLDLFMIFLEVRPFFTEHYSDYGNTVH